MQIRPQYLNAKMVNTLSSKYKKDIATITELVDAFDPCGLIKSGSPPDEYECLTQQLLSCIYNNKSAQEIKELIIHEVDHHFGMPVTKLYEQEYHNHITDFIHQIERTFR
jgi:hypothetical protein